MRRSSSGVALGAAAAILWATPAGAADTDAVARDDLGVAALLLAAASWIVFFGVRERWGREAPWGRHRGDHDETVHPFDDPPALVDALRHRGKIRPATVGTIIVDLARRGYLTIAEDRRGGLLGGEIEWRLRREDTPPDPLRPHENAVYTRLFATGNEVWVSDLGTWARANRQQAKVFVERIERYVAADLDERGYLERGRRLPPALNIGAAGVVAVVSLAAIGSGSAVGLAGLASAAGQISLTRRLRRRTVTGADRAREWAAVARTLAAVGDLDEPPADSADGWERCLVYSVTLEVVDDFLEGARRRHDVPLDDDGFAAWYEGLRSDEHRLDSLGAFAAAVGQSLAEAIEVPRVPSRLVGARR